MIDGLIANMKETKYIPQKHIRNKKLKMALMPVVITLSIKL